MDVFDLNLDGVKIITPKVFHDARGYFLESYNKEVNDILGVDFIQDNESFSSKNVFRGLHYQLSPYEQNKLIRCVDGEIMDYIVDIRTNSPTLGKWVSYILSDDNKHQMFCPAGFAHGFLVLTDTAKVQYKVDKPYSKDHDRNIQALDPNINLDLNDNVCLSERDRAAPLLKDVKNNL
jgi:dTDP-4-dehydrorhamnose 3,5-epimerase